MASSAVQMRTFTGPSVLSAGFRPFFLASAVWSAVVVPLWVWFYSGRGAAVPMSWHMHEMIFGYTAAVVGGFLLTAVPNWTGRLPVTGSPLLLLYLLWAIGRVAMVFPLFSPSTVAIADSAFLFVMAGLVWREVIAGRNWRNVPVAVLTTVLFGCNIIYHLGGGALSARLALGTILTMICLIGGRIIPSFTTNWLKKLTIEKLPATFATFDRVVLIVSAGALAVWASGIENAWVGASLLLSGVLNVIRLSRWRGHVTASEPLVLILHIGYAWLGLGLGLLGMSLLSAGTAFEVSRQSAIHALTSGAIGVMTLAVMTRASLGHTGRALAADRSTVLIYLSVNIAAVIRVLAPAWPSGYLLSLSISSLFWTIAFIVFLASYGPKLLGPRESRSN